MKKDQFKFRGMLFSVNDSIQTLRPWMSARTINVAAYLGCTSIHDVISLDKKTLKETANCGKVTIDEMQILKDAAESASRTTTVAVRFNAGGGRQLEAVRTPQIYGAGVKVTLESGGLFFPHSAITSVEWYDDDKPTKS